MVRRHCDKDSLASCTANNHSLKAFKFRKYHFTDNLYHYDDLIARRVGKDASPIQVQMQLQFFECLDMTSIVSILYVQYDVWQ